jgi:hypothetical protein
MTANAALRAATPFPIQREVVAGCLMPEQAGDVLFNRGWTTGLSALTRAERCTMAGTTGHIGESVVEILLDELGWHVLWHFDRPGRHGVDLVFLTSDQDVIAVEVKATLIDGRTSRITRREIEQMSTVWLDKADNPGMTELSMTSDDIYGGVVNVNFADMMWRIAVTRNFGEFKPITGIDHLRDLSWLTGP